MLSEVGSFFMCPLVVIAWGKVQMSEASRQKGYGTIAWPSRSNRVLFSCGRESSRMQKRDVTEPFCEGSTLWCSKGQLCLADDEPRFLPRWRYPCASPPVLRAIPIRQARHPVQLFPRPHRAPRSRPDPVSRPVLQSHQLSRIHWRSRVRTKSHGIIPETMGRRIGAALRRNATPALRVASHPLTLNWPAW